MLNRKEAVCLSNCRNTGALSIMKPWTDNAGNRENVVTTCWWETDTVLLNKSLSERITIEETKTERKAKSREPTRRNWVKRQLVTHRENEEKVQLQWRHKFTSHRTQQGRDTDTSYLTLAGQPLQNKWERGVINSHVQYTVYLPNILLLPKSESELKMNDRSCAGKSANLPSSSETSSISSTVSGKLIRCFSVVICEEHEQRKVESRSKIKS